MDKDIIRSVPIFSSLPDEEVERLAETLNLKEIPKGSLLLEEGTRGVCYYIIIDGEVEVIKALGTTDERELGVRGPGSFIGEMSLFSEDGLHTASVRARTHLTLLEMSHADLDDLLHRHPSFAYGMMLTISRRLDESENITIRDLRRKNVELQRAYDDLQAAQEELIEKEALERELDVARDIQRSILPREFPDCPHLEFGASITPMAQVGGDFFDFIPLGGDRFGIAIGDVTDHGVPAALFMMLTATLLRVISQQFSSPKEVLIEVNRRLMRMNEAEMFVTLLYGVFDCSDKSFRYARAGHELPIVFCSDGEIMPVDRKPGQPLGLFNSPSLDEHVLNLPENCLLMMYTDGVPNTLDQERQMFGMDRFYEVMKSAPRRNAQEICDQVISALEKYRGANAPYDDVTLVSVRVI
jgi:sigma-B regulation protein RsbU (phosphoserine phosphatase)